MYGGSKMKSAILDITTHIEPIIGPTVVHNNIGIIFRGDTLYNNQIRIADEIYDLVNYRTINVTTTMHTHNIHSGYEQTRVIVEIKLKKNSMRESVMFVRGALVTFSIMLDDDIITFCGYIMSSMYDCGDTMELELVIKNETIESNIINEFF